MSDTDDWMKGRKQLSGDSGYYGWRPADHWPAIAQKVSSEIAVNGDITRLHSVSIRGSSSSARLATPEVVDRPCCNSVESAYWSGDSSLTSGMSVFLMWGHFLRHRPNIKQHMSAGRVAHRKRLRHRLPHPTKHLREG